MVIMAPTIPPPPSNFIGKFTEVKKNIPDDISLTRIFVIICVVVILVVGGAMFAPKAWTYLKNNVLDSSGSSTSRFPTPTTTQTTTQTTTPLTTPSVTPPSPPAPSIDSPTMTLIMTQTDSGGSDESSPCEGSWSPCSFTDGICTKKYTITREKIGSGGDCDVSNNATATCSPGEGNCPRDCVGSFTPCSANCIKTYNIETPAANGGAACPHDSNEISPCPAGEGDCPINQNCSGSWSACTADCEKAGDRIWNEITPQSGSGTACPSASDCSPGDGECNKCISPSPLPPGYSLNGYDVSTLTSDSDTITTNPKMSPNYARCLPDYTTGSTDNHVKIQPCSSDNWYYQLQNCKLRDCEVYGVSSDYLMTLNNLRKTKLVTNINGEEVQVVDVDRSDESGIRAGETIDANGNYVRDGNIKVQVKYPDNSYSPSIWDDNNTITYQSAVEGGIYSVTPVPLPPTDPDVSRRRLGVITLDNINNITEVDLSNKYREIGDDHEGRGEFEFLTDNPQLIKRSLKIPFEATDEDMRKLCMSACTSYPINPIDWTSTTGLDYSDEDFTISGKFNDPNSTGIRDKYYLYRSENKSVKDLYLNDNDNLPTDGINDLFQSSKKCYGIQLDTKESKIFNIGGRDSASLSTDACKLIVGENLVKDVDYKFSLSPGESSYKVYEKCDTSATDLEIKPPENLLKKYFGKNSYTDTNFISCSSMADNYSWACPIIQKMNDENNIKYCKDSCIDNSPGDTITYVEDAADSENTTCNLSQEINYQGSNDSLKQKEINYDIIGDAYSKEKSGNEYNLSRDPSDIANKTMENNSTAPCFPSSIYEKNRLGGEIYGIDKCSNKKYVKYCERDIDTASARNTAIKSECLSRYTGDNIDDISSHRPCIYHEDGGEGKCFDSVIVDDKIKCVNKLDEAFYSYNPWISNIKPFTFINNLSILSDNSDNTSPYNRYSNIRAPDKIFFRNTKVQKVLNHYFVDGSALTTDSATIADDDRIYEFSDIPDINRLHDYMRNNYRYPSGQSDDNPCSNKYYTPKCYIPEAHDDPEAACTRQWTTIIDSHSNEISVPCIYDDSDGVGRCQPAEETSRCKNIPSSDSDTMSQLQESINRDNTKWSLWSQNTQLDPPDKGDTFTLSPSPGNTNYCNEDGNVREYVKSCSNIINMNDSCDTKWTVNNNGEAVKCYPGSEVVAARGGSYLKMLMRDQDIYCKGGIDGEEENDINCIGTTKHFVIARPDQDCNEACYEDGKICDNQEISGVNFLNNFDECANLNTYPLYRRRVPDFGPYIYEDTGDPVSSYCSYITIDRLRENNDNLCSTRYPRVQTIGWSGEFKRLCQCISRTSVPCEGTLSSEASELRTDSSSRGSWNFVEGSVNDGCQFENGILEDGNLIESCPYYTPTQRDGRVYQCESHFYDEDPDQSPEFINCVRGDECFLDSSSLPPPEECGPIEMNIGGWYSLETPTRDWNNNPVFNAQRDGCRAGPYNGEEDCNRGYENRYVGVSNQCEWNSETNTCETGEVCEPYEGEYCTCNENCQLKDTPENRILNGDCRPHPDSGASDVQDFCNQCNSIISDLCRPEESQRTQTTDPILSSDNWCTSYHGTRHTGPIIERCTGGSTIAQGDSAWHSQTPQDAYPKVLVNQMIHLMPNCEHNQNEHLKWVSYPAPCENGPPLSSCE